MGHISYLKSTIKVAPFLSVIADRLVIKYRNSSDLFIAAVEPIKPRIMEVFGLSTLYYRVESVR